MLAKSNKQKPTKPVSAPKTTSESIPILTPASTSRETAVLITLPNIPEAGGGVLEDVL